MYLLSNVCVKLSTFRYPTYKMGAQTINPLMLRDGIISKVVIPQKSNVSVYIDEVVYSLPVKIGQNSDNFLKLI